MRYISTAGEALPVSFREAVIQGLAPDGGLYLPSELPAMSPELYRRDLSFVERAAGLLSPFTGGEIDDASLAQLCVDAFDFPVELVSLENGALHVLELFWGPTFAFKDFGARFLARVMNLFASEQGRKLTILVATSGDTGSAVANGFAGMDAIDVVLLYPSGRVSTLQEQQLTTVGGNVEALEVEGAFDDCQAMVKAAFADPEIQARRPLSSANSINIARLLPQMLYYVDAGARLGATAERPMTLCVPSGNYGNVTGALIATLRGLPTRRLIVASNANDVVPQFLATGIFEPREAVSTPANAMDVGNPSNLDRITFLLGGDIERVRDRFVGYSVSTSEILKTIREVRYDTGYLLDPHSAVGFHAIDRYRREHGQPEGPAVFVATAHPAKFGEAICEATDETVEIPEGLAQALRKEKCATKIAATPERLKEYLLDRR